MEIASLTTVIILIVSAYIFRKPLKQFNDDAPVIVTNAMSALTKSSAQFDAIISTNCVENNVDCQKRMKAALEVVEKEELPNIQDAYNRVMQGKVQSPAKTANA